MSFGNKAKLNTGAEIPTLGYGTWQSAPGEVSVGIYEALKAGYRHLDLAKIYQNQPEVAQGLKKALAEIPGLKREDIWITSKLWNNNHRPENVEAALDETLNELGLDYLDLYLIHWPVAFVPGDPGNALDRETSLVDTWRVLEGFVRANLTRHIGVSNFARADVEAVLAAAEIPPFAHELEAHPYLQQQAFVDWHRERGIRVVAYSPLANTNPTYGDGLPAIHEDPFWIALADRKNVSVFQAVLAWGVQRGTVVIPKSTKESHIVANRAALDVTFDDDELREIAKQDKKHRLSNPGKKWGVDLFADLDDPTKLGDVSEEL